MFGLSDEDIALIRGVFERHPSVGKIRVFGSRAMGNFRPNSDIDLALSGRIDPDELATVLDELEALPLPYKFDVAIYGDISHAPFREHIDRYGKDFPI